MANASVFIKAHKPLFKYYDEIKEISKNDEGLPELEVGHWDSIQIRWDLNFGDLGEVFPIYTDYQLGILWRAILAARPIEDIELVPGEPGRTTIELQNKGHYGLVDNVRFNLLHYRYAADPAGNYLDYDETISVVFKPSRKFFSAAYLMEQIPYSVAVFADNKAKKTVLRMCEPFLSQRNKSKYEIEQYLDRTVDNLNTKLKKTNYRTFIDSEIFEAEKVKAQAKPKRKRSPVKKAQAKKRKRGAE